MMKNEIWKDIEGYEGLYQISNLGRVKSLGRKNCSNQCLKTKILNPSFDNKRGYKRACLCKNNKEKRIMVHLLVAKAFIPNILNKPIINHIDGNKANNSVDNLEWCTYKENSQHAIKLGLIDVEKRKENMRKIGEKSYNINRKKIKQYDLKGNFIKQWNSEKEASEKSNILHSSISNCIHGRSKSAGGYIWKDN